MAKSDAFEATFDTLRALLKPYEKTFRVLADEPGRYFLSTKESKTKSGAAIWFGGVEIRKSYVSFHLIPVYASPTLVKTLSPSLRKRMQGKACFNFTAIEPAHLEELTALTRKGFDGFVKQYR
jgi:hypothetical protein